MKGALGSYIDIAQVMLYLFWVFFAGLIYYLHRETSARVTRLSTTAQAGRLCKAGLRFLKRKLIFCAMARRVVHRR